MLRTIFWGGAVRIGRFGMSLSSVCGRSFRSAAVHERCKAAQGPCLHCTLRHSSRAAGIQTNAKTRANLMLTSDA